MNKECPIGLDKIHCQNCYWNRQWIAESSPSCKYERVTNSMKSRERLSVVTRNKK